MKIKIPAAALALEPPKGLQEVNLEVNLEVGMPGIKPASVLDMAMATTEAIGNYQLHFRADFG